MYYIICIIIIWFQHGLYSCNIYTFRPVTKQTISQNALLKAVILIRFLGFKALRILAAWEQRKRCNQNVITKKCKFDWVLMEVIFLPVSGLFLKLFQTFNQILNTKTVCKQFSVKKKLPLPPDRVWICA